MTAPKTNIRAAFADAMKQRILVLDVGLDHLSRPTDGTIEQAIERSDPGVLITGGRKRLAVLIDSETGEPGQRMDGGWRIVHGEFADGGFLASPAAGVGALCLASKRLTGASVQLACSETYPPCLSRVALARNRKSWFCRGALNRSNGSMPVSASSGPRIRRSKSSKPPEPAMSGAG